MNDLSAEGKTTGFAQKHGNLASDSSDKRVNRAQKFMQLNMKDKGEVVK